MAAVTIFSDFGAQENNSLGRNTGVGSLSLLQGIFPAQGSNPGLPQILYQLSHKASPNCPQKNLNSKSVQRGSGLCRFQPRAFRRVNVPPYGLLTPPRCTQSLKHPGKAGDTAERRLSPQVPPLRTTTHEHKHLLWATLRCKYPLWAVTWISQVEQNTGVVGG